MGYVYCRHLYCCQLWVHVGPVLHGEVFSRHTLMDGLGAVWHFIELAMINPLSLSFSPPLPVFLSLSLSLALSLSHIHTYIQWKRICHRYEDKELNRWTEEKTYEEKLKEHVRQRKKRRGREMFGRVTWGWKRIWVGWEGVSGNGWGTGNRTDREKDTDRKWGRW